jgi:O-acetylhomoserine/O-acetylserine sulfhydrylase-like pyridoxal-dependent enzyme
LEFFSNFKFYSNTEKLIAEIFFLNENHQIAFDCNAKHRTRPPFSFQIFTLAESLGGYESLAEHPGIMTHASVPADERKTLGISDNLVRLSVGLETVEDLIADLDQALLGASSKARPEPH